MADPRPAFKIGQSVVFHRPYVQAGKTKYPVGIVVWRGSGSYRLSVRGESELLYAKKDQLYDVSLEPYFRDIELAEHSRDLIDAQMRGEIKIITEDYAADLKTAREEIQRRWTVLREAANPPTT